MPLLRDFTRAFLTEAKRFFLQIHSLEIVEHQGNRLVLHADDREIVADSRTRTIKTGDRILARFDAIQSIDVKCVRNNDAPEDWTVTLYLSWYSRVFIGRTRDATAASIAAAHLSTITGKKVVAFS